MAVITLAEAKVFLQISDTSKDALITALIPVIEDEIKEYTNQAWVDSPGSPAWEVWMKLPVADMIGYRLGVTTASTNGMKSESQGGYSYIRADMSGGYPSGIMSQFDKVKMMRTGCMSTKTNYRDMRGLAEGGLLAWPALEDSYNADQAK